MRIHPIGACIIAATLIGACGRDSVRVSSVEQIAAAVPDSVMRERWRSAAAQGQLPPLESLPVPGRPVTTRVRTQVTDTQRTPAPPAMQQGGVPTVRPFSRTPVEQYNGPFTVTNVTATSIVGTLSDRADPFELHFRLPATAQLDSTAPRTQHRLRLRDEIENQSLQRVVILSGNDRVPLLVYISEGGLRPFSRRFEDIDLGVRQSAPGADSVARVTVTLAGATVTLRPGQHVQLSARGGPIGVFLESSFWTPADRVETSEGDPYHVTLMLYRPRAGSGPGGR